LAGFRPIPINPAAHKALAIFVVDAGLAPNDPPPTPVLSVSVWSGFALPLGTGDGDGAMNTFLVIALAVTGTLAIFFLGEIFILAIVVALTVFYAALFLFAPTIIDAIPDATKNVLIIAMMVGAVLSLVVDRKRKI